MADNPFDDTSNPFSPNYVEPTEEEKAASAAATPPAAKIERQILIEKPGFYPAIAPEQYFAEPCPEPALSNSGISILLNETPEEFAYAHPAIGQPPEETLATIAKRRGDVLHQLVLGK